MAHSQYTSSPPNTSPMHEIGGGVRQCEINNLTAISVFFCHKPFYLSASCSQTETNRFYQPDLLAFFAYPPFSRCLRQNLLASHQGLLSLLPGLWRQLKPPRSRREMDSFSLSVIPSCSSTTLLMYSFRILILTLRILCRKMACTDTGTGFANMAQNGCY